MFATTQQHTHLSTLERILLLIPALGGLVFGLAPLLAQQAFAHFSGATGNDPYIYQLAGAATFGYFVALAIRGGSWMTSRFVIIATLAFNVCSLYACLIAIIGGHAPTAPYLILATSILIIAICAYALNNHRAAPEPAPNTAPWFARYIVISALLAAGVGLALLLAPVQIGHLFGFQATDDFLYRQGGAATLGYAVMGTFELRSRAWISCQLPVLMAVVFNGISFIVTILAFFTGVPIALPLIVGATSLGVTTAGLIALQRRGS